MRPRQLAIVASLALLALSAGSARAEMVNVNYTWGFGPINLLSGGFGSVTQTTSANTLTVTHAGGTVTLTLPAAGGGDTELGGAGLTIPSAEFSATSNGTTPGGVQFFTLFADLNLTVTDLSNSQSGGLTMNAAITGVITPGSATIVVSSAGTGFTPGLTLGNHNFGVVGSGAGILTPDSSVSFTVSLDSANATPEPSALILALGAASVFGVSRLRRRVTRA